MIHRSDYDPGDVLCDRDVVLLVLRDKGSVHSHDLRRGGFTGNPSERVRELRSLGHTISAKREPRGKGRRRNGVLFTLLFEVGGSAGSISDGSEDSASAASDLRGNPRAASETPPSGAAETSDALFDMPTGNPHHREAV